MDKPNILSQDEIKKALVDLPGWSLVDGKLTKEFQFMDFVGSLSFINRMIAYFQEMDHHPDAHIFYNKVKFELIRYDVGEKITDRDVEVAKKISETYATENRL
jgi:4a-hydroxytetrahydrobiopterin dehydratase